MDVDSSLIFREPCPSVHKDAMRIADYYHMGNACELWSQKRFCAKTPGDTCVHQSTCA